MPRFSDMVIAPGFSGTVSNGFGVVFYVSNTTNPGEFQGSAGPTAQGRSPRNPFATIAAAITAAVAGRGDVIVIQRGTYTENLTIDKAGLTLLGAPVYGYPDNVIIAGTTVVTASFVSAYNIEFFSNSATTACVRVGTSAASYTSSWFENCMFSSNGTTEPAYGLRIVGGNNHTARRCQFIDLTRGVALHTNSVDYPTDVVIDDCHFIEITTSCITNEGVTPGDGNGDAGGVPRNILIRNCSFNRGETTPTTDIDMGETGISGMITGCSFARATNASATTVIAAATLFVANKTEAGVTTARPA